MPFSGNTFTLPAGATTAVAGQIIQSAVWNAIHSDINTGMTQLMSQLTTMVTGRNLLGDNGGFEVWQRTTGAVAAFINTAASTVAYTADRWYFSTGANQACSNTITNGLTNPSVFANLTIRNSGQTGTGLLVYAYPLDTFEIGLAHGATVTLTFVVKGGANWSPTNGTLNYTLYCGTGAVGKRNTTPYTGETTPISGSINVTVGGANQSVSVNSSVVIPTTTTQMELQFNWTPTGTAGTVDGFQLDDVQLEVDYSTTTWTPTSFDRIPYVIQLQNCQRHYCKTFSPGTAPAQAAGVAGTLIKLVPVSGLNDGIQWLFPVQMRATPSITTYNPTTAAATWRNVTGATDVSVLVDPNATLNNKNVQILTGTTTSSNTSIAIHVTASAGI